MLLFAFNILNLPERKNRSYTQGHKNQDNMRFFAGCKTTAYFQRLEGKELKQKIIYKLSLRYESIRK